MNIIESKLLFTNGTFLNIRFWEKLVNDILYINIAQGNLVN